VETRLFELLATSVGFALILGGCSTTGPAKSHSSLTGPEIFLAGADVQQVKSLAMGSAVTKGWEIVDKSDDRLLIRHSLDAAAAEAAVKGPVSSASVEVATDFSKRQDGVDVVVAATLIADRAGKEKETLDFTEGYKDELERSLSSLQEAWEKNRWRIASATPPLPNNNAGAVSGSTENLTPSQLAWREAVLGTRGTPDRETSPSEHEASIAADPSEPAPSYNEAAATAADPSEPVPSYDEAAAPIEDRVEDRGPATAAATRPAETATATTGPDGNMLVLNDTQDPGVWSYYAEQFARTRGCEISGRGAQLEERQPEYEIHRIDCENGTTVRVKCNAGTCLGIQ
jgi:hypothetical protein